MKRIGGPTELYKTRAGLNLQAKPLYVYKTDFFIKDNFLKDFINKNTFHRDHGKIKIDLSTATTILTDFPELNFIRERFVNIGLDYARNVLQIENDLIMPHSWMAITKKGNSHHEHLHQNALFSIVYYARVKSGSLMIALDKSTIEHIFNFHYKIKNYNIYNSSTWEVKPEQGDFIVFPADIRHSTTPNEDEEDRIIFGANFFITGQMGEKQKLTELDLTNVEVQWP